MIFKSTKSYFNFPCSHQQWMDYDYTGEPGTGQCAQTHGYSREFHFEFTSTEPDAYGWVVGFGHLKEIKRWLDFMFDHTSLWEAGDPRIEKVKAINKEMTPNLYNMRILPSGVSMEQTALFMLIHLQKFIVDLTDERCWISKLEVRENEKNSGIIEHSMIDAIVFKRFKKHQIDTGGVFKDMWVTEYPHIPPLELIEQIYKGEANG